MFVFTAKLTKKRLTALVLIVAAVLLLIVGFWPDRDVSEGFQTISAGQEVNMDKLTKNVKTQNDRIQFLERFGWLVRTEELEALQVEIPKEFDEVYGRYNDIQVAQGLDLSKYAGKTAVIYTYEVLNYPGAREPVFANVIVYKNRIIGGDVYSNNLRGFMHGFNMPEDSSSEGANPIDIPELEGSETLPDEGGEYDPSLDTLPSEETVNGEIEVDESTIYDYDAEIFENAKMIIGGEDE